MKNYYPANVLWLFIVCASWPVFALEHSGYFRSGVSSPAAAACFQLAAARSKYRLGNECDSYLEVAINHTYTSTDGAYLKGELMPYAYAPYGAMSQDISGGLQQYYLETGNFTSVPLFAASKLWLGKRYYRRHDVHITDFYYWANNGSGFGIEDIRLGTQRLAYAYKYNTVNENTPAAETISSHDFQFYNLKAGSGKLQVGIELQNSDQATDIYGAQWHFLYRQELSDDRFYEWAVQYGEGLGANLDMNGGSGHTWRVVGQWLFGEAAAWQGLATVVFERQSDQQSWTSLGVRPVFYIDQHYSLAVELGHDQVSNPVAPLQLLDKVSVALQWAEAKGFWQRPVYRAYASYADWNQAAQDAGLAGGTTGPYADNSNGLMVGLQVEVWW